MSPEYKDAEWEDLPSTDEIKSLVPVTAALHPMRLQRDIAYVTEGETVEQIVTKLCPPEFVPRILVTLNGEPLDRLLWAVRTVSKDDCIVLRALPMGGGTLKSIERAVLSLAVLAIAFVIAGPAGLGLTGFLHTAVVVGINAIGQMAINALIPPSSLGGGTKFNISGIQNQELPYGVVPRVYGRALMTPPKGAHTYTVIKSNNTYLHALFDLGPGPIKITDIKIGNTPIDDFADVQYETREGRDTDTDLTLYTNAVTQTPLYIGLLNSGDNATQRTPLATTHMEVDISLPGGLFYTGSDGKIRSKEVDIQVRVTRVSDSHEVYNHTTSITAASTTAVAQTLTVPAQASDQYDIHVQRSSAPESDTKHGTSNAYWTAIRSYGPQTGPILPKNRAKIAVYIKATEQLNGDISALNCIAQRYAQVWNGSAFVEALNTHPAWAAADVLMGTSNPRALDASRLDLAAFLEWAETYPTAEFNYTFSSRTTIWQALRTVGAAGRAIPVIRDGLYSYVFDRTQDSPVQMFTARNVLNFKASKNYVDEIQGSEVRYIAETMGWQQHSIYVYADGFDKDTVDGNKIGTLELTGVTSDAWAFKLGSYFFAASVLRTTTYTFDTDLDHLACNPGDRVLVQHDVIGAGIAAGRIKSITRGVDTKIISITTDESVTADGTSAYSTIIRTPTGGIYTLPLTLSAGSHTTYALTTHFDDTADPILVGDLATFATAETALLDAVVKTISPQTDFKATVTLLDYAPTVHSGDSAVVPPVTNDRIQKNVNIPKVSSVVIKLLESNESTSVAGDSGSLVPRIHCFFLPSSDGSPATQFDIQFQVDGDLTWTALPSIPSSVHDFFIPQTYGSTGQTYNVRVRGTSTAGAEPGDWNVASLELVSFAQLPDQPASFTVTPGVMSVSVGFTVSTDPRVDHVNLYASTSNTYGTAVLVAQGKNTPLIAAGLTPGVLTYFWMTNVNTAGNESSATGPVTATPVGIDASVFTPAFDTSYLALIASDAAANAAAAAANVAIAAANITINTHGSILHELVDAESEAAQAIINLTAAIQNQGLNFAGTLAYAKNELTTNFQIGLYAEATARTDLAAVVNTILGTTTVGLAATITAIQSAVTDLATNKADASSLLSLTAVVTTPTTGLVAQVSTLTSAVASLDSSGATSKISTLLVSALGTQIDLEKIGESVINLATSLLNTQTAFAGTLAFAKQEITTQVTQGLTAQATATLELGSFVNTQAATLVTEQQTRANADSALSNSITSLSATIGGAYSPSSTVAAALTSLSASVSSINGTLVSQSASITSLNSSISGINTTLAGVATTDAAQATAITALQTSVTSINGTLTSQSSSITSLNSSVSTINTTLAGIATTDTAQSSAITDLQTSVTSINGTLTSQSASITSLNSSVSTINTTLAGIATTDTAQASAISSLQTSVSSINGTLTSQSSSITSLSNTIGGSYNPSSTVANAISGINASVSSINGTLTSQSSSITSLSNTIGGTYSPSSTVAAGITSAISSAISSSASYTDGQITSVSGQITTLSNTIGGSYNPSSTVATGISSAITTAVTSAATYTDGVAGALSSSLSTLSTTVAGHTSSISTLTTSVNGYASSLVVTVNGNGAAIGWIRLDGTGASSKFTIAADKFEVYQPGGNTALFALSGGVAYLNVPLQAGSIYATNIVADNILVTSHFTSNAVTRALVSSLVDAPTPSSYINAGASAPSTAFGTIVYPSNQNNGSPIKFDITGYIRGTPVNSSNTQFVSVRVMRTTDSAKLNTAPGTGAEWGLTGTTYVAKFNNDAQGWSNNANTSTNTNVGYLRVNSNANTAVVGISHASALSLAFNRVHIRFSATETANVSSTLDIRLRITFGSTVVLDQTLGTPTTGTSLAYAAADYDFTLTSPPGGTGTIKVEFYDPNTNNTRAWQTNIYELAFGTYDSSISMITDLAIGQPTFNTSDHPWRATTPIGYNYDYSFSTAFIDPAPPTSGTNAYIGYSFWLCCVEGGLISGSATVTSWHRGGQCFAGFTPTALRDVDLLALQTKA